MLGYDEVEFRVIFGYSNTNHTWFDDEKVERRIKSSWSCRRLSQVQLEISKIEITFLTLFFANYTHSSEKTTKLYINFIQN